MIYNVYILQIWYMIVKPLKSQQNYLDMQDFFLMCYGSF